MKVYILWWDSVLYKDFKGIMAIYKTRYLAQKRCKKLTKESEEAVRGLASCPSYKYHITCAQVKELLCSGNGEHSTSE